MSRRKQLKPMQIRNNSDGLLDALPMNLNGKQLQNEDSIMLVSDKAVTNHSSKEKAGLRLSEKEMIAELSVTKSLDACTKSILADLSCLIPDEEDETSKKSERKENFLFQQSILKRFAAIQSRRGGRSRGRGRGRGRGRNHSFGTNHAKLDHPNQSSKNITGSHSILSTTDNVNDDDKIMRCRICSKPFKRQWSLQVHELIHHQAHDSIPENLALTLAPSDRRRLVAGKQREKKNSLKRMRNINGAHNGYEVKSVDTKMLETALCNSGNEFKKDYSKLKNSACQNTLSDLNSDTEDNNNETTSQSSETGSLSAEPNLAEHLTGFQHTPMFSGITVPTITNFRELRRQVSLARRTCKYCGKVCFKPSDLQRHLMKHTGERPFSCSQCGRKFKAKRSLHYHQRASHGAVIELSPALEDKFAQTKKYKKMLLQHFDDPILPDAVNDNSSLDSTNGADEKILERCSNAHSLLDTKDFSDQSDDNEELSSGLSDSDREIRTSSNQNYPQVENFIAKQNRAEPQFNCSSTEQSVKHENHKPDGTDNGNYEENDHVPSSEKLNADVIALIPAVPADDEDNVKDNDKYTVILPTFSGVNNDKHSVFTHYKINLKSEEIIASKLEGINTVSGEKVFLYKCHLCGKIYSIMSKLQNHLTVHMKRNKKQYICTHCGEMFKFRSQWLLHSRTHKNNTQLLNTTQEKIGNGSLLDSPQMFLQEGQPSNPLDQSNLIETLSLVSTQNGFSIKDALCNASPPTINIMDAFSLYPSNVSLPSPENDLYSYDFKSKFKHNYNCRYCGKYFDRPFSLQRHERMHTGIKPCYCKDCGRGFSEPRNLRHHIIRFHSDGSLHHLLRRNRYKGENMSKPRSHNNVLTSKNSPDVKTEVLSNSPPHKDNAESNVTVALDEMVPCKAEPTSIDINQNTDMSSLTSKIDADEGNNEAVTVVIPTGVENVENQSTPFFGSHIWEQNVTENMKRMSESEGKEILTDPKRSLIGNRRKQRPQKMTGEPLFASRNVTSPVDEGDKKNSDGDQMKYEGSSGEVSTKTSPESSSERPYKRQREEHWQTRMTVASLLARERGIEIQPRKGRSRSRNSVSQYPSREFLEQTLKEMMTFACCFCNKLFSCAADLSNHMELHKGSQDANTTFLPMFQSDFDSSGREAFSSKEVKTNL